MIPMFQVHMEEAAVTAAAACLRQPMIGEGAIVDQFERELGVFLALGGNPTPTLTTNSCTAALHLAVNVLKRRHPRSDGQCRFLASPLTCLATNMPLLAENVDITWVDTDPVTCNISLRDLQQKLRSVPAGAHGYDGILFVHWAGVPLDMAAFESIRTEYEYRAGRKLMVIEDCAHALGATYAGAPVGGIRNIGCFSFQSIKPVTTIDGGCLTVPNHTAAYAADPEALYEDLKLSRWFGLDRTIRIGCIRMCSILVSSSICTTWQQPSVLRICDLPVAIAAAAADCQDLLRAAGGSARFATTASSGRH
jgi:dTDP-4-amino-4,6-dideoxygalactose transaminase